MNKFLINREFLGVDISKKLKNKIKEEIRVSGIPYIVLETLSRLDIYFPSLEKLKNLKKAFLSKMFV